MKVLNIEVIDMYDERFSKENYLEVCLNTTNGAYIAKVSIIGVSDIEFWRESYGVSGSPTWIESNVHDVLTYKVKAVSDDDGEVITNTNIVSAIESAVYAYDFSNVNEEVAEILINEMRESYDCDAQQVSKIKVCYNTYRKPKQLPFYFQQQ